MTGIPGGLISIVRCPGYTGLAGDSSGNDIFKPVSTLSNTTCFMYYIIFELLLFKIFPRYEFF